MQEYNLDEHMDHIYANRLDDFFNYLSTQTSLYDALWCAFEEAKENKFCAQTHVIIRRNQWKAHVYRLMEKENFHLWMLLREFAIEDHEDAEESAAADKADAES